VAFAKLYDRKTPITAADLLNDRMLPFFEQHDIRLCRVLTDRDRAVPANAAAGRPPCPARASKVVPAF